ncbi:MAG: amidohydrolase family protein [Gemmatales bacterium]
MMSTLLILSLLSQVTEPPSTVLKPMYIFDGTSRQMRSNWIVIVRGEKIAEMGPASDLKIPNEAKVIDLPQMTLLPGLIDAHSHLLLHPYNETSWEEQVLKEPLALRVCRATNHAKATLLSGFTTLRDLGTEGAGYADVGLKQAIQQGIIPGPRLLVTTKAIVATGTYAPKGFAPEVLIPQGAEEADGNNLVKVVRDQISHGADWIKVYADYRWGPKNEAQPTFSIEELKLIVDTAASSGRKVCAHATSKEGMRRAALAGVATIEHGTDGDVEAFRLMASKNVALAPTLATTEAMYRYRHPAYNPDKDPEPEPLKAQRAVFKSAIEAGVTIICGSDVGVFTHGTQSRELELMHKYGMQPIVVMRAATTTNAKVLGIDDQVGAVKPGLLADLIAVEGNLFSGLTTLRQVKFVMKSGKVYKQP